MRTKVLVISHNCFSTFQSMGKTLKGLFGAFDKKDLCQLYLYPSYPNIDVCNSYFRITDTEVFKSVFTRQECGNVIDKKEIKKENLLLDDEKQVKTYSICKKRKPYMMLGRDLIWKIGNWKSEELLKWVINENPDVIFYASGDSCFSYNITKYLSQKLDIPIVTYFCDDYYTIDKFSLSPLYWTNKILIRKWIKKIIKNSKDLIYISEEFEQYYFLLTGRHGKTIMTPYSKKIEKIKKEKTELLVISYIGNVSLNRWKTLISLGEALKKYNSGNDNKIILNIYSRITDREMIDKLSDGKSMFHKGYLSTDEVRNTMEKTDFLLHVESFNKADVRRVRFSISTKIADCLASNRPLIAIGPDNIASIKYLKENNAAYVVTDINKIDETLRQLSNSVGMNEDYSKHALKLAEEQHNSYKNGEMLRMVLQNVVENKNNLHI